MPQEPFNCRSCGRPFSPDDTARQPPLCPHCGEIPIIDDLPDPSPEQPQALAPDDQHELEGQRIEQIVRVRRSVLRIRGWCITAAIACLVLAAQQIIWLFAALFRAPWSPQQTIRLSLAIILLAAAVLLRQRITRFSLELRRTRASLPDPATPPDFSSLSDGSQHIRNLENLDRDPAD